LSTASIRADPKKLYFPATSMFERSGERFALHSLAADRDTSALGTYRSLFVAFSRRESRSGSLENVLEASMARHPSFAAVPRRISRLSAGSGKALWVAALLLAPLGSAAAQGVDCTALRAKIAAVDAQSAARPNRYSAAARKQRAEIDRTVAYAASLGCDQPEIPFFGRPLPARCPGLNSKIAQMQANLAQLEVAATAGTDRTRQDLITRYDAYCRAPIKARQQAEPNFFEALFGAFIPPQQAPQTPAPWAPPMDESPDVEPDTTPRGGSQALCVRSCDGGFFPLHVSARNADASYLTDLCQALCPNVGVSVYTRAPHSEIDKAVSLDDGSAYSDLPNARKFRSSYEASCSCKPPHQSWVEALAGAERILGEGRRGDIVVTPESSERLSQAQPESRARNSSRGGDETSGLRPKSGDPAALRPSGAVPAQASSADAAASPSGSPQDSEKEVVGPDGVKRRVRIISPTL
jgi:hypothetical protein